MKLLIQRVLSAQVLVNQKIIGLIGPGVLVFLGVTHSDTPKEAASLADKLLNLRIFENNLGKIHHSLQEQKGAVLVVSQFTLYADCSKGRRPSFTHAAAPDQAELLYRIFIDELRHKEIEVATGQFGAEMQVSLINDGPFTLFLEV